MLEYGCDAKLPYMNKQYCYNDIEDVVIHGIMRNNKHPDPKYINLDDYKKMSLVNDYLRSFAVYIVRASTPDTILPPKSFFKHRDAVRAKYAKANGVDWYKDNVLRLR